MDKKIPESADDSVGWADWVAYNEMLEIADNLGTWAAQLVEILNSLEPKPRRNMAVLVDMPSLEELPRGGEK